MSRYVVLPDRVAASLAALREPYIHPHFAMYLCLKRAAKALGRQRDLPLNYIEFYEAYFRVDKANPKRPWLRPFLDEPPSKANRLLNKNAAGSYAPSSLRKTLLNVVDIKGEKPPRYSFQPKHWELARSVLMRGAQVPIADLVIVLYRDYALETTARVPSIAAWIAVFREEFGYEPSPSNDAHEQFDHLYSDDGEAREGEAWFKPLD